MSSTRIELEMKRAYIALIENKEHLHAIENLIKKGNHADGETLYQLAMLYHNGWGTSLDSTVEFRRWIGLAAAKDHAEAKAIYGEIYIDNGLAQEKYLAIEGFKTSAEKNCMLGQYYLGKVYADGRVITENKTEAIKWLTKAAEQGCVEATSCGSFLSVAL